MPLDLAAPQVGGERPPSMARPGRAAATGTILPKVLVRSERGTIRIRGVSCGRGPRLRRSGMGRAGPKAPRGAWCVRTFMARVGQLEPGDACVLRGDRAKGPIGRE